MILYTAMFAASALGLLVLTAEALAYKEDSSEPLEIFDPDEDEDDEIDEDSFPNLPDEDDE